MALQGNIKKLIFGVKTYFTEKNVYFSAHSNFLTGTSKQAILYPKNVDHFLTSLNKNAKKIREKFTQTRKLQPCKVRVVPG